VLAQAGSGTMVLRPEPSSTDQEVPAMFAAHCPSCDRKVLLGNNRITGIASGAGHHRVDLRCRCGATIRWSSRSAVTSP
jgi:hypothetical protein